MKPVAIYARVSSERQKEQATIVSQTTVLLEHAVQQNWTVPNEWRFLDEGYSGASLVRPGLDSLRDRIAEGQIDTVLVLSPDRLSRKYAYQILLTEEFHRHGTELVYLKSPPATTPEEQLLAQVQGMIAEYERAQIIERTRRGKRHRARQGTVNVLSGAPYGYRYVKKSDGGNAYYEVIEAEAAVVRMAYEMYTVQQLSIGAITRGLNEQGIPTRTGDSRWERSTVWAILRNPAYVGKACFGKTERKPRERITRRLRQRGGYANRCGANQERPREEWIEIGVPPIISEAAFALAQERLQANKQFSQRRTIEPSLLQSLLVCAHCGYGLYRCSTRTTKHKLYYYRCLGSDAWRHLKHSICDCPPVRQDYLDGIVWDEVIRLLEDPTLLQAEITRRLEAAKQADPAQQRQQHLVGEQARLTKSMERLLTAYQESLLSLDELRKRIEPLRKQHGAVQAELQAIETAVADQHRYLRLVESLAPFQARLRERAESMDIVERQRIVRLLVKEVIIGPESITIRHCLPMPSDPNNAPSTSTELAGGGLAGGHYLLRSGSHDCPLWRSLLRFLPFPFFRHPCFEPFLDQSHDAPVRDPMLDKLYQPFVRQIVEKTANVHVEYPVHLPPSQSHRQRVQRIVLAAPRPKPIRESQKVLFVDCIEHRHHCLLHNLVLQRGDPQWPLPAIGFWDVCPS
jgi:site-specific DNA recombinase